MNKLFQLCFIVVLSVLLSACSSKAQVVGPLQEVNGQSFYFHTVEKGQTLYAISKIYKCDVNSIASANPGADISLKEGQIIKIPRDASGIAKGKTIVRNNKSYISHTVDKRETLYSIAKLYNVDINLLVENNPGSENGIKKGQEILIPIPSATNAENNPDKNFHQHEVVAGETLFALSRQYKVSVEAIKSANPGMQESLSVGQKINIPVKALPNDHSIPPITETTPTVSTPVVIIGGEKKEKYTAAILLPFFSQTPDSLLTERDRTFRDAAINLYRGIQMAADTLQSKGLNATIHVKDVVDGKSSIKAALTDKGVSKADLFIGPGFKDPIQELSIFSQKTGAHIVVPFPLSNKVLLSSPNMSKACPSEATVWEAMGAEIAKTFSSDYVVLINSTDLEDTRKVQVFAQSYWAERKDSVLTLKYSGQGSFTELTSKLSKTKRNVVVLPSKDKKAIYAVFEAIKNTNSIVIGPESWENLETISADNRNKYQVSYPNTIYLDYSSEKNIEWMEAYRRRFKTEPTEFSVLGYDLFLYYGTGLLLYGKDFPNHFSELKVQGLQGTGFDFFRTGNESGFENKFYHLLQTSDFSIQRIR